MSVKRSDVVNLTGGVETRDGRTLYGMDAELYLKMVDKEDPEWEKKVAEWIEKALGEPLRSLFLFLWCKPPWKSLYSSHLEPHYEPQHNTQPIFPTSLFFL
jgi:hypothetical protein